MVNAFGGCDIKVVISCRKDRVKKDARARKEHGPSVRTRIDSIHICTTTAFYIAIGRSCLPGSLCSELLRRTYTIIETEKLHDAKRLRTDCLTAFVTMVRFNENEG
jgi:hypothetical protein